VYPLLEFSHTGVFMKETNPNWIFCMQLHLAWKQHNIAPSLQQSHQNPISFRGGAQIPPIPFIGFHWLQVYTTILWRRCLSLSTYTHSQYCQSIRYFTQKYQYESSIPFCGWCLDDGNSFGWGLCSSNQEPQPTTTEDDRTATVVGTTSK
jgi:hypothetical protein